MLGATGRQGGATLRALEKTGRFTIVALSRQAPDSADLKALVAAHPGVEIVRGDANDKATLLKAFKGAWGVFGVTNPFAGPRWSALANITTRPTTDMDAELRQGLNIVDACKESGVQVLVFSSVASARENTGVPTFDIKGKIEDYIVQSGMSPRTAVLAPVGFYENLLSPFAGIKQGVVPGLMGKATKVQMCAVADIGTIAAMAFSRPADFLGKCTDIAGDKLSSTEMAATLAKVRGEDPKSWHSTAPPELVVRLFIPKAIAKMREWMNEKGTRVDVEACRRLYPQLMTFEDWCRAQGLDKAALSQPSSCAVA